jgi:hypothetical protein
MRIAMGQINPTLGDLKGNCKRIRAFMKTSLRRPPNSLGGGSSSPQPSNGSRFLSLNIPRHSLFRYVTYGANGMTRTP